MFGDWSASSLAGILGGAYVRRAGGSPYLRFPACTQIWRLPRTHEGPAQRSGGRLRCQRGQRQHHSGDGIEIVSWTHNHLVAYIYVFCLYSCKKKLLNLAQMSVLHYFVLPMRIAVTGFFVSSKKKERKKSLLWLAPLPEFYPDFQTSRGESWRNCFSNICFILVLLMSHFFLLYILMSCDVSDGGCIMCLLV